ncbi:MAG: transglutaminaseTgpA domain-containing protein [Caldilineaceae bacterium]
MTTTTSPRYVRPFRYTDNLYFQDGLLFTAILAALLYLLIAASLDGAGYIKNMGLLYPTTLGAIAMSLLMAYSRFDSFFAFSHGMFTGLAWILYLMAGLVTEGENKSFLEFGFPPLQAKVYFVLFRLLTWTESAWHGSATADNYMFIFEICFLIWWLTYLGIWSIFRHGYTWRAVTPAGVVLLINTYYAPSPVTGFLVVFAFLALMLLVRTNLAEQQLRWRFQRTYFSQDISLDFLRTGFMYTMIVLALAWLVPGLNRSAPVRDILRPINSWYEDWNAKVNELYPSLIRQTRPSAAAFGRTLTLGGERNVSQNIIFTVSTTRGRYWRAVVFDHFDGRQWQNTSDASEQFAAETPLPIGDWQMRTPITQTIQLLAPTGDVIFGAPDISWADVPLDAQVEDVPANSLLASPQNPDPTANRAVEFTYARSRRTLDVNSTYTVISRQTEVTVRQLEESSNDYPQAIRDKYLQLPDTYSARVAEVARSVTESQPTAYAKAKALETYLRGIPYDDKIPAPPANTDPIEYFLFDVQAGYCDYYATAMATMLRSLGIPARTASGYAEGSYDEESGLFFVTEADAHTWVEVYFPEYGWIEFEPTAGESVLSRPSGVDYNPGENDLLDPGNPYADQASTLDNPMEDELLNPSFSDLPLDGGALGGNNRGGLFGWPWWVWALLTPLLLLAGIWGLRRSPVWGPSTFTSDLPPILYDRLQRWTDRLGIYLPANETPYEHSRRLVRALPQGRTAIQRIIQRYVVHRFSRQQPQQWANPSRQTAEEQELRQSWQALERLFWKAWVRKLYSVTLRRRTNPFKLLNE